MKRVFQDENARPPGRSAQQRSYPSEEKTVYHRDRKIKKAYLAAPNPHGQAQRDDAFIWGE
ncbi:MAG: hypothetical protein ACUVR0_00385 [Candidatus Aminicenantales bacterium]